MGETFFRKLSFGCGSIQEKGWYNLDKEDVGQTFVGSTELFEDNFFDIIVAHCSLQITEWHDLPKLLKELHRILKDGGVLRISLPDIVEGFRNYIEGNINWFPNGEEDLDEKFSSWIQWYSTTRTLLTQKAAIKKLKEAGFVDCLECTFGKTRLALPSSGITYLDSRNGEVFFIESMK